MKNTLIAVVCVLLISSFALAQDFPKAEIFGGYALQYTDLPDGLLPSDSEVSDIRAILENDGFTTHFDTRKLMTKGFQISATFNLNEYLGFEGNFRYNKRRIFELNFANGDFPAAGQGFDMTVSAEQTDYAGLGGPHFTFRKMGKIVPFAHVLAGVDFVAQERIYEFQEGPQYVKDFLTAYENSFPFKLPNYVTTDNGLGLALGGGVDYKVNDYLAIRLIQADYYLAIHNEMNYHNMDLTFGAVYYLNGF